MKWRYFSSGRRPHLLKAEILALYRLNFTGVNGIDLKKLSLKTSMMVELKKNIKSSVFFLYPMLRLFRLRACVFMYILFIY